MEAVRLRVGRRRDVVSLRVVLSLASMMSQVRASGLQPDRQEPSAELELTNFHDQSYFAHVLSISVLDELV
jgi:hypothetical protein